MWTPRRLALLAIGFVVYLAGYLAYARSHLGIIDGLPALPEIYARVDGTQNPIEPPPVKRKPMDEKLKDSFGNDCDELTWPIKLELRSKDMILAAQRFEIAPDGRVLLKPISVAIFGKNKGDPRFTEINTIRSENAYLTFDRPVATVQDISGRKLTAAELIGHIMVVNNRKTVEDRTDDLSIFIPQGPVYFQENKHLIWTHDAVHLVDLQSKPKPTQVDGTGMEMELLTEAPAKPGGGQPRKAKQESISGVKRIVLQSGVDMYLYVDSGSAVPAGGKEEPAAARKPAPTAVPEKAKVHITAGRFQYDFGKDKEHDTATFDVPDASTSQPVRRPQDVVVTRTPPPPVPGDGQQNGLPQDTLVCQKLVLQLGRKQEPSAAKKDNAKAHPGGSQPEQGMEIQTAHATGTEVTLTSDAEKLEAHCIDLLHDARAGTTVLKGNPNMTATKDGNVIICRELQIQEQMLPPDKANPEGKKYHNVTAIGPGHIDMMDANTKKTNVHAYWDDKLVTSRDGPHDLLVLTGNPARFVDDDPPQSLQARTLKLWLDDAKTDASKNNAKPAPAKPKNDKPASGKPGEDKHSPQDGRRPHHLEALEDVVAKARDVYVHDTSRLVVWFKDVPEDQLPPENADHKGQKPGEAPAGRPGPAVAPAGPANSGQPSGPPAAGSGSQPAAKSAPAGNAMLPGMPASNPDTKDPPQPIDLTARSVEAWVLRSETRNVLDHLRTKGEVHVVQEPAKADEKGVDIKGDELNLIYHADGNELTVTGDVAQLRMDKIYILGPEVNIDQRMNKVWVWGPGAMQMDSNTTFGGEKTAKTVPMTVHWNKQMLFHGNFAEFSDGIQAEQGTARLACDSLRVQFDRVISLKEGSKSEEKPAKVEHLLCDQNVRVEEAVMDGDKLVKWQQLICSQATQDTLKNEDEPKPGQEQKDASEVNARGPGTMRIFQKGGADAMAASNSDDRKATPKPAHKNPDEDEKMKLTYVNFTSRMYANSQSNTAKFWGNVRVLDMPSDNPQQNLNLVEILNDLPKDALYLSCEQLTVLSHKEGTKTNQEMEALRRVVVQSREFWGRCEKLTYNEAKDQIVFHGTDTEPARLFRQLTKGGRTDDMQGKTIVYIRSTGAIQVDGGNWIQGR